MNVWCDGKSCENKRSRNYSSFLALTRDLHEGKKANDEQICELDKCKTKAGLHDRNCKIC